MLIGDLGLVVDADDADDAALMSRRLTRNAAGACRCAGAPDHQLAQQAKKIAGSFARSSHIDGTKRW